MCGQVSCASGDRDVVDRLALRHVFVVQIADVSHAASGQDIDLAGRIGDDQLLAELVVVNTRDTGAVQAGLAIIDRDLLGLFIHAEEATVGEGIHPVRRRSNLRHVVVGKVGGPFAGLQPQTEAERA